MSNPDLPSADLPPVRAKRRDFWLIFGRCLIAAGILLAAVISLMAAIERARHAARSSQSKNNLKQIGLALLNYHDAEKVFPPGGIFDEKTTGYFGWQMSIMPYLDASPLYNSINMNVPWDHPPNADLFHVYYLTYLSPFISEKGDREGFGLTHYSANSHLFFENSSTKISDITDGPNQTILVGEIASGFPPYAKPGNWRDPALGLHFDEKTFGRPTGDGALFLMADGSVRWIERTVNPKLLQALATPAGGEDASKIPEK